MSGIISGSLTPTGGLVPVNIDDLFSLILDPAAYSASGSTVTTTGSISLGGTTLFVDDTLDFEAGQGIYVQPNNSAIAPFITTIVSVFPTTELVLAESSPHNFTGNTIFHDDVIALNAAITSGFSTIISGGSGGFFQVNGGGRAYNVSGPLTQQSGLALENFKLIPLASSFWVSGTLASGNTTIGPISNGVIYNPSSPSSAESVVCRDIVIDLDTLTVNGFANDGEANILYENCFVKHWGGENDDTLAGIGFYNAGKCLASNCKFLQWEKGNLNALRPDTFNSGYALYIDHVNGANSGDSLYHGCNFSGGLRPVFIADGGEHVRFSDCHTWPLWFDTASTTLINSTNFEIHGSDITIEDHYLDSGRILIVQDAASPGRDVKIDIGVCTYSDEKAPYSSHVLVTASGTGTLVPGNIFISPESNFAGTLDDTPVQILQFEAPTGATWGVLATSIQSEALAAQSQNLLSSNGGLLFAELGTATSVVATFMGSSPTATSLSFIDSATTITPPPQVGSEGNDIVLSSSGIVTFSGSADDGWQAFHGGTTNPQGYTINFTNAAPNNKTDVAFGFMDTMSATAFKTAI